MDDLINTQRGLPEMRNKISEKNILRLIADETLQKKRSMNLKKKH